MGLADKELQRMIEREFAKRPLDCSRMNVHAVKGIIYLNGQVSTVRGHNIDLKEEMEHIIHILKQRPGVRDVVNQLLLRAR